MLPQRCLALKEFSVGVADNDSFLSLKEDHKALPLPIPSVAWLWKSSVLGWLIMTLSCPLKEDHKALPLPKPLSSMQSLAWCLWHCTCIQTKPVSKGIYDTIWHYDWQVWIYINVCVCVCACACVCMWVCAHVRVRTLVCQCACVCALGISVV